MKTQNYITPFEATHPGVLIKDELDARSDINQKDLAKELGVKASFLNEIIKGKRPITADYAIILEKALEIPATYWMKFQTQFEIDKARIKEKNIEKIKNIEDWNTIKEYVPIRYFKKHKYLTDSLKEDINKILNIYGVSSIMDLIDSIVKNRFAFYRKSVKLEVDEKNICAWSSLAIYEAKQQKVNVFHLENIDQLCLELNDVFFKNIDTVNETKRILNEYGIKFIIIPKLEKAPIDGYSFWSNQNPVIALTLRHSRIDNFAFTVMHEIGHIVKHLIKNKRAEYLDLNTRNSESIVEKEANYFAESNLIPEQVWEEINMSKSRLNDDKIIELSNFYKVNPAIIFGHICHKSGRYRVKTKIDKKLK